MYHIECCSVMCGMMKLLKTRLFTVEVSVMCGMIMTRLFTVENLRTKKEQNICRGILEAK